MFCNDGYFMTRAKDAMDDPGFPFNGIFPHIGDPLDPDVVDTIKRHLKKDKDASATPALSAREEDDHYVVEFEVPGYMEEDLELELNDNKLTLTGKKESTKNDKRYMRQEIKTSQFKRTFAFPKSVTANEVEASLRNGILTVIVPKSDKVKSHKITIK